MNYLKIVLKNIWEHVTTNWEIILKTLAAVWFFFAGIHMYLYAVMALTIADVITGVIASLKRGEPFTSRKLRKGLLEKMGMYLLLILTVFVLDLLTQHVFHHEAYWFSWLVTFLISTYEVSSLMENLNTINPDLPFLSKLVGVFKKLHQKSLAKMEERVDDIVDEVTDFKTITDQKKDKETEDGK